MAETNVLITTSGNRARLALTCAGANTSVAINWDRVPTEQDTEEYDRWFYTQHPELEGRKIVSRDMTGRTREEIAARMLNFARTGRLTYPEEN